jgi:hypothetical protein
MENKMCFHFLYNFVWNISHSKKKWGNIIINTICLHVKYTLFLSYFNKTWIFSTHVREILNQILWKSFEVELSVSIRAGGPTDMIKTIVAFRSFANTPKIGTWPCSKFLNGNIPFWIPRCGSEDNIKIDREEIWCKDADWFKSRLSGWILWTWYKLSVLIRGVERFAQVRKYQLVRYFAG